MIDDDDETIAWPVVGSATCTRVVFGVGGDPCGMLCFFGDDISSSGVVSVGRGVVNDILSPCVGFMTDWVGVATTTGLAGSMVKIGVSIAC